jgi:hypothetical protein
MTPNGADINDISAMPAPLFNQLLRLLGL